MMSGGSLPKVLFEDTGGRSAGWYQNPVVLMNAPKDCSDHRQDIQMEWFGADQEAKHVCKARGPFEGPGGLAGVAQGRIQAQAQAWVS